MHPEAASRADLRNRFAEVDKPLESCDPIPLRAPEILRLAADIIDQRGRERDSPEGERSMADAVAIYGKMTGVNLTIKEGWLFMVALKFGRMKANKRAANPDDYIDAAAYLALCLESITAE